ncbi:MAG: carboxypeptidase regulatory-like domain-containing protein [Vicinamibacterales bacterium]
MPVLLVVMTAWMSSPPVRARATWPTPSANRGPAAPGSIRGRVRVNAAPQRPPRPSIAQLATAPREPVDRRTAVVFLDTAPRQAFDDLPQGRARMDQRHEQFVPRVLAITVGTVVEFPNSDTTFHNVFSLSRVRTFDLGRYPPGRTGTVRFDRPGIVPISCDIHSHMSAYVLVFSHPFFAVTDADGRYAIGGVPAGTYTLRVWSELGEATPRRITVPDGGTAEADFAIGGGGRP